MSAYRCPDLLVGGRWRPAAGEARVAIVDPATGETLDELALCSAADLQEALDAAGPAFEAWRQVPAHERCLRLERGVARIVGEADRIARLLTQEQGKPLAEARAECLMAADLIKWYAEEARRTYGRIVPARQPGTRMDVLKVPVGPVAAFSPWNFPLVLSARKLGGALAAGCPIVLKAAEETPASVAAMVACLADELPPGVIQLVYGVPAEVSQALVTSPVIRKVSFTGSVPVGRHLAQLAGRHLKRITLELGGHAPVIVCEDADLDRAVRQLVTHKFRNAGQACLAPTRFFVARRRYGAFLEAFTEAARGLKLGPGLQASTQMGPVANARRRTAVQDLVARSIACGARKLSGDAGLPTQGFFVAPTILADVPLHAPAMQEEPFGPVACLLPFDRLDEAIAMANGNAYGLAGYLYTDSARAMLQVSERLEVGSLAINGIGVSVPEAPFGGVKDSGHGSESGCEGIEAFLETRFNHHAA
ncbi:NAD-dependent succinate-semialdehyde dehydrogenase [Ramlibacter sp. AW1]|uniref:4-(hydroxymethyl)benzenesulfonate dehydrogenase n=1 Tax=Ramlibacter aurantiacus TaxID=2801330 RepID=A0A936ZKU3_9BURK|nr:NAD-dependent succinate-semialdehyde dehydrogenase [Ramlibacter aurantiacus]MBL0419065.1 NAD-dependent succinate-semialdehyde dehydrogenase [Ramlibacter aurantiacus]